MIVRWYFNHRLIIVRWYFNHRYIIVRWLFDDIFIIVLSSFDDRSMIVYHRSIIVRWLFDDILIIVLSSFDDCSMIFLSLYDHRSMIVRWFFYHRSLSLFQAGTMIFIVSNRNNDYFLSLFRFGAIIFFYSLFRFGTIIFFIIVRFGTDFLLFQNNDFLFIIVPLGTNHRSRTMVFYCSGTMILFLSLFLWEQIIVPDGSMIFFL